MASLKEVKGRIASVKSTQKITSAMKMVSSSKLRKAQSRIEHFLPYEEKLKDILDNFLSSENDFASPLTEQREIKSVAIIVLSSNSSLCGAFNHNIIRMLAEIRNSYAAQGVNSIAIYPIGKKVETSLTKAGIPIEGSYIELMDKPHFEGAKKLADLLINSFLEKTYDKVELVYNHFKSTASQPTLRTQFLPLDFQANTEIETLKRVDRKAERQIDYILEPSKIEIIESLIPKALRSKIFSILLDSAAAEQAARMIAMQMATENADVILEDLTIQYNKQRQQDITNELLDIVGGAEACK
ncbi:F0F1 ATP synthase subunit gamma [Bacteroidales bacterium]|nr:F0F1 ATP synthase subunit gamma [Bacteroidales bacterium]